jgi:acetolactate synthase I/III small subunit
MQNVEYIFFLEVRDVPGVLVRTAQVFARRSANISAIHVTRPENSDWSDMKITVFDMERVDQIALQLEKLVDVNKVTVHKQTTTGDVRKS